MKNFLLNAMVKIDRAIQSTISWIQAKIKSILAVIFSLVLGVGGTVGVVQMTNQSADIWPSYTDRLCSFDGLTCPAWSSLSAGGNLQAAADDMWIGRAADNYISFDATNDEIVAVATDGTFVCNQVGCTSGVNVTALGYLYGLSDGWQVGRDAGLNIAFDGSAIEQITITVDGTPWMMVSESTNGLAALGLPPNVTAGWLGTYPNYADDNCYGCLILGGGWGAGDSANEIWSGTNGWQTIINGVNNKIRVASQGATIVGGTGNQIAGSSGGVVGGEQNWLFGEESVVFGGHNSITRTAGTGINVNSGIMSGYGNTITTTTDQYSVISGGRNNEISGTRYAAIPGGYQASADHYGEIAHAAGQFATVGDAQAMEFVARRQVTHSDTNWYTLWLDGASLLMTIPNNGLWNVSVKISGLTSGAPQRFAYNLVCSIYNDGGTTTLGSSATTTLLESDANYDARCLADNTNDALLVQVGRSAGTNYTIRWVATVEIAQVIY